MVRYQGNKSKYGSKIVNHIRGLCGLDSTLWDLCCGSGEISAAWARKVNMIDLGPWGKYWRIIYELKKSGLKMPEVTLQSDVAYESFVRRSLIKAAPLNDVQWALTFLGLQREAFSGKAVDVVAGHWKHPGFSQSFNLEKYRRAWERSWGIDIQFAQQKDINDLTFTLKEVVYIDPDYKDTTGYGQSGSKRTVDVRKFIERNKHCDIFVSHHYRIEDVAWCTLFDVSVEGTGREARGSSKDETELLHFWRGIREES